MNIIIKRIIQEFDSQKTIIVNRDRKELPEEFRKLISDKRITYLDLNKPLDSLEKFGINPNYWKVTKQKGRWNKTAHKLVAKEITKMLEKKIK